MADARYYSIALEPDDFEPGAYRLRFTTAPGMSAMIGELRTGDLDALATILRDRNNAASGERITATPRPPAPGMPCAHCGGVGSACQCDVEYI